MSALRPDRSTCRPLLQLAPHLQAATYRHVLESLPHAIIVADSDLRIVMANRAAASLFAAPAECLTGLAVSTLVPHANLDVLLRGMHERPKILETSPIPNGRGGALLTLKIRAVRLGRLRLLMLENISDTAALEQRLVETEKQAAMAQLAAGIIHEVANPLTSLGSNLLFIRGALGESRAGELTEALDVSLEQLEQMRQLLGTLSGLPRRPSPCYERVDLHDVIRRCVTFVAKDAECRDIAIAPSLCGPTLWCEIDARLIKQVLINLLKNAMESMPLGGRIEVRTSRRGGTAEQPEAAIVEVADTGIGIPEADLRKVFRPLFSTKPRGAGLGLSFCRQAVEDHGGEIRLASAGRDRGTVAIISLPLLQTAADDE